MSQSSTPRTAVVTGGNSGIGLAVARGLGQKGFKIWIAGRDAEKGRSAAAALRSDAPAGVEFIQLDVMRFAGIEQFLKTLKPQLGGRLDALIHSTGSNNSARVVSSDGLEAGWATQFLGRYLLTEALTPELSNSDDGRVVHIASLPPKKPHIFEDDVSLAENYTLIKSIEQAQSALALYIQQYASEHPNGPSMNSGMTGIVNGTDIRRSLTGFDKMFMGVMFGLFGISVERAAKSFIALASDPALKGISGHFFSAVERTDKHYKIAYRPDQLEVLRRVVAKYSANKSALVSA